MRTHFLFNPIHRAHYISYNISFFFFPHKISQRANPVTIIQCDVRERVAIPFSTNLDVAAREIHICSRSSNINIAPHPPPSHYRWVAQVETCRTHQAVNIGAFSPIHYIIHVAQKCVYSARFV